MNKNIYYKYFWAAISLQFAMPMGFFTIMPESAINAVVFLYALFGLIAAYFARNLPKIRRRDYLVQGIGMSLAGWMISAFFGVVTALYFKL